MSNMYQDDEAVQDSDLDLSEGDSGDIKSLRRAASGKKKLEQELLEARRELAFARAGIDTDDPRMKYFVKGYEGDFTAAAVRSAAIEAGFIAAPSDSQTVASLQAAQDRVATASAGAAIEDASEEAALARMAAALDEGGVGAMMDVARQYGIPIGSDM
jgi:hypothetical protein